MCQVCGRCSLSYTVEQKHKLVTKNGTNIRQENKNSQSYKRKDKIKKQRLLHDGKGPDPLSFMKQTFRASGCRLAHTWLKGVSALCTSNSN